MLPILSEEVSEIFLYPSLSVLHLYIFICIFKASLDTLRKSAYGGEGGKRGKGGLKNQQTKNSLKPSRVISLGECTYMHVSVFDKVLVYFYR